MIFWWSHKELLQNLDACETRWVAHNKINKKKRSVRSWQKSEFYATNEGLPRQIFNEVSVHSITQDCSSNKTKITKQNMFRRPYLEKTAPAPTPPLL